MQRDDPLVSTASRLSRAFAFVSAGTIRIAILRQTFWWGKTKAFNCTLVDPESRGDFFDELTTGLDTKARRSVWQTLLKLKEAQMTILLTTHYMEEAEIE